MSKRILAVVTTQKENVAGGAPIFVATSNDEMQKTAFTLEKILGAMVHQLTADTLIIVHHK